MAYMSQERKAQLAPTIKAILKKYGLKGSLGVHHHSTLTLNISEGKIDFLKDFDVNGHCQVNEFYIDRDFGDTKAAQCLKELKEAMNIGNHDNSEPMTDYFDVGWYISINIGKWDKPYKLIP